MSAALTIYSVFSTATKRYEYYTAPGDGATHAGASPIRSSNDIGATVDQAAWALPPGAVKIGSGDMPRGRIATLGSVGYGDGAAMVLMGVAAYVAWKVLSR